MNFPRFRTAFRGVARGLVGGAVVAGCAFLLVVLVSGCRSSDKTTTPGDEMATRSSDNWVQGTVRHIELEGGFYAIESDDGAKYYPINLADTYKENGKRVQFTMRERSDVMTTVMWGTNIEILEIEAL